MDVGTPGVRVLLIKSLRAERETNPSGVTGQAQQEINCSSGEKVYTFTQMLPFVTGAPLATPAGRNSHSASRVGDVNHRISDR